MTPQVCPHCDAVLDDSNIEFCGNCKVRLGNIPSSPMAGVEAKADNSHINVDGLRLARQLASRDSTRGMIIYRLKQEGIDSRTAAELADQAQTRARTHHRAIGLLQMVLGGILAVTGGVVTVGTMIMAKERGGTVTITYGAIFIGVVIFLRGLVRTIIGTNRAD